jgi:hypothetical protein
LPPWKPGIGFSNEPSKIGMDLKTIVMNAAMRTGFIKIDKNRPAHWYRR